MPAPRWIARFNRRATNRVTSLFAGRVSSFGILIHTGRRSGQSYRTPVNVFRDGDDYIIVLTYGAKSDWVRNVMAAGTAELVTRGRTVRLANPRLVVDPNMRWVPFPLRLIPRLAGVTEYLRLAPVTDTDPARRAGEAPGYQAITSQRTSQETSQRSGRMSTDLTQTPNPADAAAHEDRTPLDVAQTACCVVGAGPAGVMLALLLARAGVAVTLLEEHGNFDRDFRGDTVHPSTMEILREIGLDHGLLALPHSELRSMTVQTRDGGDVTVADFRTLKTSFPFINFMPQTRFLEYLTTEAARYPTFRLVMGARVEELVTQDGVVRGVRYRGKDGWHELRARLTVGCDGRFSRLRRLGDFDAVTTSPPMDVLWFRLPRNPGDPPDALARLGSGHLLILLDRGEQWQVAAIIPKGSFARLRAGGIEALHMLIMSAAPELADRMDELTDWRQVSLLAVASDRLRRWYRPGLLLIGDAAHTMSPVGGVGINYAIQDAVVTANRLYRLLQDDREVPVRDLAAVQRSRELPTRFIQALQATAQRRLVPLIFSRTGAVRIPGWVRVALRLPGIRAIGPRIIGFGIASAHVTRALRTPVQASATVR